MNSREVLSHFAKENHLRDGDPPEKISLSLLDHLISIVENSGKMWKVYGKYVRTTSANYKMDFAMALCPFPEVSHRGEFGSKRPPLDIPTRKSRLLTVNRQTISGPRLPVRTSQHRLQAACLKNVKLRLRVNFPNAGNLDRVGISRTLQ